MKIEERELAVARLAATRVRKALAWARQRCEPIDDAVVQIVVRQRLWPHWGYPRLLECLYAECGLDQDKSVNLTMEAINGGYEDAKLYGVSDDKQ